MPDPTDTYVVTRRPGAPARRAGLVWPVGDTEARLSPAEADAIGRDPGFDLCRLVVEAVLVVPDQAETPEPAPVAPKAAPTRKARAKA